MVFKFNPFTKKLDVTGSGGGGGGSVDTLTGNSGGAISPDGSNNINIVGTGAITVSGDAMTNTLTIDSGNPFYTWTVISANQMANTQEGYFTNGGSRVEVMLPAISFVGDTFCVADYGGNGWRITQDVAQQIFIGNSFTTSGATGYIESIEPGDVVCLVCVVNDTTWMVVNSMGNITVV